MGARGQVRPKDGESGAAGEGHLVPPPVRPLSGRLTRNPRSALGAHGVGGVLEQGKWLGQVVRGYFAYHAVPTNIHAMASFRTQVVRHWRFALLRRSQRGRVDWGKMGRLAKEYLPKPCVLHPWPEQRFDARIRGKSRVR